MMAKAYTSNTYGWTFPGESNIRLIGAQLHSSLCMFSVPLNSLKQKNLSGNIKYNVIPRQEDIQSPDVS